LAGATQGAGRPGYDPADMLKLYLHLYGYFNRVRSSRCLAAEAGRNLGVMWLLGGLRPDVRTIADFRGRSPPSSRQWLTPPSSRMHSGSPHPIECHIAAEGGLIRNRYQWARVSNDGLVGGRPKQARPSRAYGARVQSSDRRRSFRTEVRAMAASPE